MDRKLTLYILAGMVLGIEGFVAGKGGGYYALETVHVAADGPRVLSTLGHGPLAADD